MRAYSLSHLSDRELLHGLVSLVAEERAATAALLAHLAEFDARRLYLPVAYASLYAYCVQELHFSEQAALKRWQKRFKRAYTAIHKHQAAVIRIDRQLAQMSSP